MQIEFSQAEADLMDEALKDWAQQPIQQGFTGSMMSSILRGMSGNAEGKTKEEHAREVRGEIEEARKQALGRERRALLLRAKLAQAMARESEHAVGEPQ